MSTLPQVIFFSLIGGVISLIGGLFLLADKKRAAVLANYATPFAAGALLAAAFVDLLPEAMSDHNHEKALNFTLVGILSFFILERFLRWFHHHHEHEDKKTDPTALLIIVGDTVHNFIDGIAIAAGFLVSPATGVVVTLAVAAHEIPQEIGDFGLLLRKGLKRNKVILVNGLSALATTLAAIIFFQLGRAVDISLGLVLGLVAGFFIYIAVSDIIPSIHKNEARKLAGWQSLLLLVGVLVVGWTNTALHDYLEPGEVRHDHDYVEPHDHEAENNHDLDGHTHD